MSKVREITEAEFDKEVLESNLPVLVDFWAPWCGPCKMLLPVIDEIHDEYEGRLKILKVNVDDEAGLAQRFNIMTIPTLIIFKDGDIVFQEAGAKTKEMVEDIINEYI